jgi:hypothetical protein
MNLANDIAIEHCMPHLNFKLPTKNLKYSQSISIKFMYYTCTISYGQIKKESYLETAKLISKVYLERGHTIDIRSVVKILQFFVSSVDSNFKLNNFFKMYWIHPLLTYTISKYKNEKTDRTRM